MEDGQLSDRVDKGVDGCGGLDYESAFSQPRAAQAPPPNFTPLPPLRDQGILEPGHKGNTFPSNSHSRWYN